jgi:hypothetical protein
MTIAVIIKVEEHRAIITQRLFSTKYRLSDAMVNISSKVSCAEV